MSFLQALILGIIQGLTEYLPISSSAHLVLVPFFLRWQIPEQQAFIFDVLVQMGTLLAVIVYFWKDLIAIIRCFLEDIFKGKPFATLEARLGWFLILATTPAGLFGLLIKKKVEAAFNSPAATGAFLLLTALLLIAAERIGRRSRNLGSITWLDALWIGVAQAISVFPGVSRSGSTIAGGMARHFDRTSAARFSFLMAIPVMLAAGLLETLDVMKMPGVGSFLPQVALGIVVAGVVGYISIRWLLHYVMRHSFYIFAIYCAVLGAITLVAALVMHA